MDEIIRRNLVIFARAVYNDDAGISEEAHNAFLEVIEAAGGFIPGCPGDKQLFEELQDIRRLIDATDGRFYLPTGIEAVCENCGKPADYHSDVILCPDCEKATQ